MRYRFDPFELDLSESSLLRDGRRVELQPKVFDALRLFVENRGRLVSKDELLGRLWPDVIVSDESLTQVIRKLRLALDDDPQQPRYIETVPKRGYRFLAAVRSVEAASPSAPPVVESTAGETAVVRRTRPLALRVAAAVALLAAAVTLARFAPRREAPTEDAGAWRERRLTATAARESYPMISPNGDRLAFVRPAEPGGDFDLFVADLSGAESRLTATAGAEYAPQFSPDGRSLLYARRDADGVSVWRIPALGGAAERLVDDADWPTWAPDGARIAFVRRDPARRHTLRALRLVDGSEEELWSVEAPLEAAVWSRGGAALAAVSADRVLVGPAKAGAEPRPLGPPTEYIRSLAWEPGDASLLADGRWTGTGGNLVRLPLDGGAPRAITRGSSGLYHPSTSRDGRRLVYAAEHKVRQLWRFDERRGAVAALALPTGIECFDVSPDGAALAVTDWLSSDPEATLASIDLATGSRTPLGAGLCPAYSADGRELAFLDYREGKLGLWILDLASGDRRRIADDNGDVGLTERNAARRPAFSPDRRQIAFEGTALPEGSGIFIVDLGSGARRLVAPGVAGNLAWSPDGRWLAASGAGEHSKHAVIDARRGGAKQALDGSAYRASPVWLDGRRVAFLVEQQRRPAFIAVDAETLAAETPMPFGWPPDASFWGMFEALPDRRGGWIGVLERYESDLFLLEIP